MRYLSQKQVSYSPSEHTLLDVPISVDSVVSLAGQVAIDVSSSVVEDGADLSEGIAT